MPGLGPSVNDGKTKYREEMSDGRERAGAAFVRFARSDAFGERVFKPAF
jgi:NADPH-dependent curcumin reductase CurA